MYSPVTLFELAILTLSCLLFLTRNYTLSCIQDTKHVSPCPQLWHPERLTERQEAHTEVPRKTASSLFCFLLFTFLLCLTAAFKLLIHLFTFLPLRPASHLFADSCQPWVSVWGWVRPAPSWIQRILPQGGWQTRKSLSHLQENPSAVFVEVETIISTLLT